MERRTGCVYLVGAGPGDAELLTIKGSRLLQQADCIVYDKLIDDRLLELAPPHAERVYVGKEACRHCIPQAEINQLLIDRAKAGAVVVRLKGGDPLLFARGGEEAVALNAAGVPFEIVPGVTAALAAAATAGVPLTQRLVSSAVAFVTGHETPGKSSTLDWRPIAEFPGTLVIYMALTRIARIASELVRLGKDGQTPVLLVEWGGTNRQRTRSYTLEELAGCSDVALQSPVLAVIGEVCKLREQVDWFGRRPLAGKTVLVPRASGQLEDTARRLSDLGARVLCEPVFEITPPDDWGPVDQCFDELSRFDWLVFTSRNGVTFFLDRLLESGRDLRALGGVRLATVGPGTAEALADYHLKADLVPPEYRAESLAEALAERAKGKRVLLARADRGRAVLVDSLRQVAEEVRQVTVYRQRDRLTPSPETLQCLKAGEIDYVLLSSSNMASGFFRWLDDEAAAQVRERVKLVSMSPLTSERIRSEGFSVSMEAETYTMDGMLETLLRAEAASPGCGRPL